MAIGQGTTEIMREKKEEQRQPQNIMTRPYYRKADHKNSRRACAKKLT